MSAEQPSIIDDLSIRSGFYGCQALGIVCVPKAMAGKVNGIGITPDIEATDGDDIVEKALEELGK